MKFILTAGWDDGVADLTERLVHELADGKRVLWLVSGGSNIPSSVHVMDSIPLQLRENLSVMLVDERYGEEGHADSNWTALMRAGFKGDGAKLLPALQKGLDFEQTITRYNRLAEQAFDDSEVSIAQLGIGDDGHIGGILPNSPAAEETEQLVIGYPSEPYTRLTLSFAGLRRLTAAFAFAFGENKHEALTALQNKSLPLDQQPAQILKELPEAYLYSDQVVGDGR